MKTKIPAPLQLAILWFVMGAQVLPDCLNAQATFGSQSERLAAEHQQMLNQLNAKTGKGQIMDLDDPRVPALVKQGWRLAGLWAASYLDAHPSPSKAELEGIFQGFAPKPQSVNQNSGSSPLSEGYSFEGSAVQVGSSVYVVTARYVAADFPTGTFMVVARNAEGHFQALWNIKDLAEKHYPLRDEIGRWAHLVRRSYYNGPLDVEDVIPLSIAANGHARFLIQAYQGADGSTILAQISIWEWDGAEAKPLLVKPYEFSLEHVGFRIHGNSIRITTKEELQVLFSSAPSPEPRATWTLRITPGGVQDLGRRFLQPEIRWVDQLLAHIVKGEDASGLANTRVIKRLKARIAELEAETASDAHQDKTQFAWGMLEECRVLRRGQRGAFVLIIDGEKVRFDYVQRHGKRYFTNLRFPIVASAEPTTGAAYLRYECSSGH